MREPYWVCGGLQDAGSSCGPSADARERHLHERLGQHGQAATATTPRWIRATGGSSTPSRNPTSKAATSAGSTSRRGQRQSIRPNKNNITNWDEYITPEMEKTAADRNWGTQPQNAGPLRFNWSTPFFISPHNPQTLYIGVESPADDARTAATTWRIISPDLTKNDPEKTVRKSGGLTPDENPGGGAEYHCTIITLAESPIEPGNIWVGTDDGNVQVTRNDGGTWAKVGTAGLPGVGRNDVWVSRVEPSHHARGTGVRVARRPPLRDLEAVHLQDDRLRQDLDEHHEQPAGRDPIYVVKEDLKNPNLLFAGSEFAAFYSLDGGAAAGAG